MIGFSFSISNPFSKRFETVRHLHGQAWKNKFWEFNIYKTSDIIGFNFRLNFRQDHAGLSLGVDILGRSICFDLYDNRHWDADSDFWVTDK